MNLDGLTRTELLALIEATDRYSASTDTKFDLYRPTDIARYFHASDRKVRANFGGNRSSKTYSHIIDFAAQFLGREPAEIVGTIPPHRLNPARLATTRGFDPHRRGLPP